MLKLYSLLLLLALAVPLGARADIYTVENVAVTLEGEASATAQREKALAHPRRRAKAESTKG